MNWPIPPCSRLIGESTEPDLAPWWLSSIISDPWKRARPGGCGRVRYRGKIPGLRGRIHFQQPGYLEHGDPTGKTDPSRRSPPPAAIGSGSTITEEEVTENPTAGAAGAAFCGLLLIPRKGLQILIAALTALDSGNWHLTVVGNRDRDARYGAALRKQIAAAGLDGRITFMERSW